jgi:3-oxoacyl-[acyl-carrier protein] reductase
MLIIFGANGGLGSRLLRLAQEEGKKANWKFGPIMGFTRADLDFSSESSVSDFVKRLESEVKSTEPLYVINATGVSINGLIHKSPYSDFEKTLQVNLGGNFLLLKHLHPLLKARPGSSVAILSSIVGETGVVGTAAYASSKSGLRGLCRVSSKEFSKILATVNLIECGYFEAGMIEQVPEVMQEALKKEIPLNRFGRVEELFEACKFALSCGYLTGTAIKLNGGM